jgi:hypothetical protein
VSHDEKDDLKLAKKALTQIKETKYGEGYQNPVLLGLVVNDKARRVTAWEREGGLTEEPKKTSELKPLGTGKSARPKTEDDEESGPWMV